jgi:predicted AAA+ superfamily ATPase
VQKALGWSESVKRLWDEDTRARRPLKVVLLGSAPLLVQQGLTESLAGRFEVLHLANAAAAGECELFYWRERNYEVDFVVRAGRAVTAIEVKSGRGRDTHPGLAAFADAFKPTRKLLVGGDGIPVEEVLREPVAHWVKG